MQQIKAQHVLSGTGYKVGQSVYMGDYGSANSMVRTMDKNPSGSNFTISTWIKMGPPEDSSLPVFYILTPGGSAFDYAIEVTPTYIVFRSDSPSFTVNIGPPLSDYAVWYHLVFTKSGNDYTLYLNGHQVGSLSGRSGIPNITNGSTFYVGSGSWAGSAGNSYLSQWYFIDGPALGPEHFALEDSDGNYNPIPYTGTYGNNGFFLEFEASDIGADASGNDNDFQTTGLTPDSIVADSPTNNYSVIDPTVPADQTLSKGNLKCTTAYGQPEGPCTIGVSSGKWYFEGTNLGGVVGLSLVTDNSSAWSGSSGNYSAQGVLNWRSNDGDILKDGDYLGTSGSWANLMDVGAMAIDMDARTYMCYLNGVYQRTESLTGGLWDTATEIYPATYLQSVSSVGILELNFGQRTFAYDPPEGYLAINSQNMENQ